MAIDRIYSQYRNSPKSVAWYNILPTIGSELDTAYSDIKQMYDIDSQIGAQLDLIGRVVVQPRNIVFPIDADVAEFGDNFAEFGDETTGAVFSSALGSDNVGLTDEEYRLVLKSKIQRNTSDVTIDSIITAVNTVLTDAFVVQLVNGEDMTFSLIITGTLTATEIALLASDDFIPTPQGVRFTGFLTSSLGSISSTLDDATSNASGTVEPVGNVASTLDDVTMVASGTAGGVATWDSIYSGDVINPLFVDVESGSGDVWFSPVGDVYKWDSVLETHSDQSYTGTDMSGIGVNGVTSDVYVTSFASSLVYKRTGGVGAWVSDVTPQSTTGPTIDSSNDDVMLAQQSVSLGDFDQKIYQQSGGVGAWNDLEDFPLDSGEDVGIQDCTVDSSNQDVWVAWDDGILQSKVWKLTAGAGSYVQQGAYPESRLTAIAVDSSNGDVWLCTAASGNIYKRTGGVGSYDLIAAYPGTRADDIAVNPTTGEVYVADSTDDTIWRYTP